MKRLLFLLLIALPVYFYGQNPYALHFTQDTYKKIKKNIPSTFRDSLSALKYVNDLQVLAIQRGYLLASIDTLLYTKNQVKVAFHVGEKFTNVQLQYTEEDARFLRGSQWRKYREKQVASLPFSPTEIHSFLKSIQEYATNHGFPFCTVRLEKIHVNTTTLQAKLRIDKGDFYTFNAVHIKGDSTLSSSYIANVLDIRIGQQFSEQKLRDITKKISQLLFIQELKPHELLFTPDGVELFLYLKSNPISSINGAVGLQPNSTSGRVALTGELNLKLLNVFKRGELVQINWRSIQENTQSFNGKLNFPFLFRSPFGIDGQFQLYKRDSTFLEVKSTLGMHYFLRGGDHITFFYQNTGSDLLKGSTSNPNFTNLSSVRTHSYGLSFSRKTIDYLPNPTRGIRFYSEIAIGTRRSSFPDSAQLNKTTTYKSQLQFDWLIPLSTRHVLRFHVHNEIYYAPEIFQNEVFRFGGQTNLRGFNEEELYATNRATTGIEYRFLLDKDSHVFAFYDQGIYENNASSYYRDNPFGFGAGLSFGTKLGVFSISYALGKQFSNPISFQDGKIHFGYISFF